VERQEAEAYCARHHDTTVTSLLKARSRAGLVLVHHVPFRRRSIWYIHIRRIDVKDSPLLTLEPAEELATRAQAVSLPIKQNINS
jgi:hypothetical protein